MSLFAVVWRQGQISPIHDHGTGGAVTVVRGSLHEEEWSGGGATAFQTDALQGLVSGAVTAFTNRLEYVHRVSALEDTTSLHLYGGHVAAYHGYDERRGICLPVVASPPHVACPQIA